MPEHQPRRRGPAGDSGFTLTELVIVVVIVGILTAIAIPLYLRFTQTAYTATVKADIHTLQLLEQSYAGDDANPGGYASTSQLISANPTLKLSPGSVAAVVWSSADGYCVGAANTKGPPDAAAPFAPYGYPYRSFFYDSRSGTMSTTLCDTPSGAAPIDGSYIDDSGGH